MQLCKERSQKSGEKVSSHKRNAQDLQNVYTSAKARGTTILLFFLGTVILSSLFYLTLQTGWSIDTAEYKLIVGTKGHINNITATVWIYYFNASTASVTTPQGINIETDGSSTESSRVQISFEDFKDELAIIVFSNMEPLRSVAIDKPYEFTPRRPIIDGELENSTNFFSHLFISASTPMGKTNVYSFSIEAIVKDGKLTWNDWPQSKKMTLTVFVWALIFLSATISSICITTVSFLLKRKVFQTFPIVTLLLVSAMCFIYLHVGVGNDLLSISNADLGSRLSLSLLSNFFHFSYDHLMGNLLGSFIIGGSLIEIWLPKFHSLNRYFWYFFPVPLSILISVTNLFWSPFFSPGFGSSFWSIGIAVVLVLSILRGRPSLSKLTSVWDFIALLFSGYLVVSSTWNYLASLLIYYYSEARVSLSVGHLLFVVLYLIVIWMILRMRSRKEASKFNN